MIDLELRPKSKNISRLLRKNLRRSMLRRKKKKPSRRKNHNRMRKMLRQIQPRHLHKKRNFDL